jgi:hypothetical protein
MYRLEVSRRWEGAMPKKIAAVFTAALIAALSAGRSAGASTLPAGRADPCSSAATWAARASRTSARVPLEQLAGAERACAATFANLADACPHALTAGDSYVSLARGGRVADVLSTVDLALAFDAYSFAVGACRGDSRSIAMRGAASAARHMKENR